ncbi:hypothetical protein ACWEHA_00260 [Amycolatopsis nivea]
MNTIELLVKHENELACGIAGALKGSFSDQVSRGVDVHEFRQPLGVVAGPETPESP